MFLPPILSLQNPVCMLPLKYISCRCCSGCAWLVAPLQDSTVLASLGWRGVSCPAAQHSKGSQFSKLMVSTCHRMNQCWAVCLSVTWGGNSNSGISLEPQVILCSQFRSNCAKIFTGQFAWVLCLGPTPFQGHLHSKHVLLWEVWRERWGKACPEGLFPPLLNRTAVSVEKQNPAYLSGCGHA